MRLFLALKPDRPAEARLAQRVLQVQEAIGDVAGALRWTPATNIHATLHFLGEVPPVRAAALRAALAAPIALPPFEIEVDAVGAFPASGAPRVIWLDFTKGADGVLAVHEELAARLIDAGVTPEARSLSPHLTVARVPDRERARVKPLRERLQQIGPMPITWTVAEVALFRSDLSGAVPRYDVLQETPLTPHGS